MKNLYTKQENLFGKHFQTTDPTSQITLLPLTPQPIHPNGRPVTRLITALLTIFTCWQPFLKGPRFELRIKNGVKNPRIRHRRSSHKLKTSFVFNFKKGQTIVSWTNKAQLWWASFLSPVLRKIFDYENGSYQTNSRRQQRYSWVVQQAPKHPFYILQEQWLDAAAFQVQGICGFCQKTLPSGHPKLTGILKGCAILKSGPQMLNRNSSTKSLPALTSPPRFLFRLSVLFPPNFPYWQPE